MPSGQRRVGHGIRHGGVGADGATFAEALDTQRIQRCRDLQVNHLNRWNVSSDGHRVIHQAGGHQLALAVVDQVFQERTPRPWVSPPTI